MGTSGISECYSLVANTLQKHRWFFNCKGTSEGWHTTHHHARSLLNLEDKTMAENMTLNDEAMSKASGGTDEERGHTRHAIVRGIHEHPYYKDSHC